MTPHGQEAALGEGGLLPTRNENVFKLAENPSPRFTPPPPNVKNQRMQYPG